MGVPVITCPGETFAGRSFADASVDCGADGRRLPDMTKYIELAVSLASDLPGLAAIRSGLREKMAASPLCDGK